MFLPTVCVHPSSKKIESANRKATPEVAAGLGDVATKFDPNSRAPRDAQRDRPNGNRAYLRHEVRFAWRRKDAQYSQCFVGFPAQPERRETSLTEVDGRSV